MSDTFTDYLRGKRVVLVGPSASLCGTGQGAYIDGHDVIVRVNLYDLRDAAVRADVGSRTDVLYHVLFSAKHAQEVGYRHTAEEAERWRADGLQYLVTHQQPASERVRRLRDVAPDAPLVHVPTRLRDGLRRVCGTAPNTGTIAIAHLLSMPIASLYVTGFDFYASPYYAAYVGFTEEQAARGGGDGIAVPAWGQTDSRAEIHEQSGQKRYLATMYERDKRLRFDEPALVGLGLPAEGPKVTALVPMKGHSERVPGKNTRVVAGKPLLAWLLGTLGRARRVERIVVDTDSETIARLVREHAPEAQVLMRPEHLRDGDSVTGNDLIAWELTQVEGEHFGQFHVTSPLLEPATIDRAIAEYFDAVEAGEADSLFAVTEHHFWLFRADGSPLNSDTRRLVRSQDLEPLYEDNNALHLFSRSSFEREGTRIGQRPRLFPISKVEAVDIDYEDDIRIAEALLLTRDGEAARTVRPGGKYQMGAVVYRTSKQADGSYLIVGKVDGQRRRVVATFAVPDGVAPTIAMAQQALREGGAPADESAGTEPAGEAQDAPTGDGEPVAEGDAQALGNEGGEASDAVTELLSQPVAQLADLVASVEDVALLETALAAEEAGKGRKTALEAIQGRIEALTAAVGA